MPCAAANVLVANSLGSGLLESGMLLGFLPRLAERLLASRCKMPSVATWWCGEPASLEDALARLKRLIIKPAFTQLRFNPVFGQSLTTEARDELAARMRARPNDYVAAGDGAPVAGAGVGPAAPAAAACTRDAASGVCLRQS